ncbi:MAG: tyrosine-type recombinase/integrase [Kordiimonadaceae bacterium]|nr:tyrosine-type recombinase/integrase [Kordiimonadaceae bacterium]
MKLTKRSVDALMPEDKEYGIRDIELKGFGIRVMPSGRKTYQVQYRAAGRTRKIKIGVHGQVTADEARREAKKLLSEVAFGANPSEDKRMYRDAPLVSEVCDRFVDEHVKVHLKPTTQRTYKISVEKAIKPKLGKYKVKALTRADVSKFMHGMRDKPIQANRTFAALSKLMNLCEQWGLRPDGSNPCRHVKKYKENKRERYLSPEELERLGIVLNQSEAEGTETPFVVAAFKLLILTGARLGEIQTLKWEYIKEGCFMLPDSKTGAKKVYFGPEVQQILDALPKKPANPYVIAGTLEGEYMNDMQKPWRRIRKRAGLEDVRIHDLRHTFASVMVGAGHSLPTIGKMLGHSQPQTTARYAHLADAAMHDVANSMSGMISGMFKK